MWGAFNQGTNINFKCHNKATNVSRKKQRWIKAARCLALTVTTTWSVTWQLQISHSKCHTLTLGPATINQTLFISQTPISVTPSIVDLGITIDPDLNFKKHIHDIVVRAKQRAALIHRCFISRKPVHLVRAYIAYVRPLLEYATQVWSPHHVSLINLLETVQRGFTKRIPGFWNLSYAERLEFPSPRTRLGHYQLPL